VQFVWSGPTAALTASRVVVVDDRYLAAGRQVAAAAGLVPAVVEVDPAATPGAPITVFFAGPQVLERPDELTPSPDVGS
jgi:hypothetical protein